MKFKMSQLFFPDTVCEFTELTAPKYLREGGIKGSTMDNRWFWNEHVLTLEIGEFVDTDFQRIERIK